jgi:ATP/maltotriose-dependent transcriptional regulator MalT
VTSVVGDASEVAAAQPRGTLTSLRSARTVVRDQATPTSNGVVMASPQDNARVGTRDGARAVGATDPYFVGRRLEVERLAECAEKARSGSPWLVMVMGDVGIGKTAFVRRCVAELQGFTVLRAMCDELEVGHPFGVVSQLVARAPADTLASFPALAGGLAPDAAPIDVGGELLGLLGALQDDGPVALVVDDLQWADAASVTALALVLRRLWADRVLTILTSRSATAGVAGEEAWRRLMTGDIGAWEVRLDGLRVGEVAEMAKRSGIRGLSPAAVARLHQHTAGHPLYVQRLLADLSADTLADLTQVLPVPATLARTVQQRLPMLSSDSRQFINALAVLDGRYPVSLVAQVAGVEDAAAALEPLVAAGLVNWWPTNPSCPVSIHHKLQRQAIYEAIDAGDRRRLHAAAAPLVDATASWAHRVAAADRADPALAAELEQAAAEVFARGNAEQAATWLLWSADLSDVRTEHERRVLAAAQRLLDLYESARALTLAPRIRACLPSPARDVVLGMLECEQGKPERAEQYLQSAFGETRGLPGMEELNDQACTWLMMLYHSWGRSADALAVAEKAGLSTRRIPGYWNRYTLLSTLMLAHGPAAALRETQRVEAGHLIEKHDPAAGAELVVRGYCKAFLGELTGAIVDLRAATNADRSIVPMNRKASLAVKLAYAEYLRGDWDAATVTGERALAITLAENAMWNYAETTMVMTLLTAGRGDWSAASKHLEVCWEHARRVGKRDLVFPSMGNAALAQAQGDYRAMARALEPIANQRRIEDWPLMYQNCWRPMYVEALIATKQLRQAIDALAALREVASETHCLDVAVSYLTARLSEARGWTRTAFEQYAAATHLAVHPDEIAILRAHLERDYGRMLISQRNVAAARDVLRRAHTRYASFDARPFQRQCSELLKACGVTESNNSSGRVLSLTEREREIARLAARGMSNGEIAKELYLSVKTIEVHLTHAYGKLGITSRRELRAALRL